MEIINWIKDFWGNVEFDLVVNLSDIITVIVFLFTITFNIYTLKKEKKRFQINLDEQKQQFEKQIAQQQSQFKEQMHLQITQYEDNRKIDLRKNRVECLPILLLKNVNIQYNSLKETLEFNLIIKNCGKGIASNIKIVKTNNTLVYDDIDDKKLYYYTIMDTKEIVDVNDEFELAISSSITTHTYKEVKMKIQYQDLMGREYIQPFSFVYYFPTHTKAIKIKNFNCELIKDID